MNISRTKNDFENALVIRTALKTEKYYLHCRIWPKKIRK